MKHIYLFISLLILSSFSITYSQDSRATTQDGQTVILRKNGSWFFYNPSLSYENMKTPSTTATTPNGQVVILKRDGTWIKTSNYQKTASNNYEARKNRTINPNVARLARAGHGHEEIWDTHYLMLNKPAPTLELYDWLNGEYPQITWNGKIIVVDFWATWCGPCRSVIPHNNELYERYKEQGVIVVGACASGGRGGQDRMGEVVEKLELKYPTAKVEDRIEKEWNVRYYPTYAIIDRSGTLRAIGIDPDYVEPIIKALLEED